MVSLLVWIAAASFLAFLVEGLRFIPLGGGITGRFLVFGVLAVTPTFAAFSRDQYEERQISEQRHN